jgi:ribonuclease Y
MDDVLVLVGVALLWVVTIAVALTVRSLRRERAPQPAVVTPTAPGSATAAQPAPAPTPATTAPTPATTAPTPATTAPTPATTAPTPATSAPDPATSAATSPAADPHVSQTSSGSADALALHQVRAELEAEFRAIREDIRVQRLDLERRENRLTEREERLDAESRHHEQRARQLADQHAELDSRQAELNARRDQLTDLERERTLVLERTAGLTAEDARSELVATIENQARRDAALITRDIEREAQVEGELRARRIITGAIQRLATEQTTESVVSVMHLPSDDMKGRIIGREGRNIRTFESVTGVNLIIDDTPEAVLLSCFDPVRREVARLALEALVLDGRIHPQRIEDAYEKARGEVEALCVRAGADALVDVGITRMHPELVAMLGRLRYRTSYGQNVLKHLLESAHIAGMMASELGLDPSLMRRCALLHDIGKALTHEVEGSHAIIGAELARKYGENDDVVHAIEAHHNEVEPHTLEAVLTQAADAISGGRPGARRESLEAYVKRLERLEEIASSYDGVEKVFAMQAGREVRVMVLPDAVDDIQAQVIAREIAKQVEHELTYPGQIRVTVVRESRATEVAR